MARGVRSAVICQYGPVRRRAPARARPPTLIGHAHFISEPYRPARDPRPPPRPAAVGHPRPRGHPVAVGLRRQDHGHPGSDVTLTLTLTNPHDTAAYFVYESVQPTYGTTLNAGLKYAFSSCGGNVTACDTGATSGLVHHSVPVAAGATTTVTLTYTIGTDSACGDGARIDFYTYLYYEYASGAASDSGIFQVPGNEVTCS